MSKTFDLASLGLAGWSDGGVWLDERLGVECLGEGAIVKAAAAIYHLVWECWTHLEALEAVGANTPAKSLAVMDRYRGRVILRNGMRSEA